MNNKLCPACNASLQKGLQAWHRECPKCGYEKADFSPAINSAFAHGEINEQLRESGLKLLRVRNFQKLLGAIIGNGIKSGSLLDVGCAYGWFLEVAKERRFDVLGIEPDLPVFRAASRRGLSVRNGFFPDILLDTEKFNGIVFNDVFEHIPDVQEILKACGMHLLLDGVLVLNLPNSSGILYKLSRLLCRLGICSFFERLWQKKLPSPHLHYFNPKNIEILLQKNGFEVIVAGTLPSVRLKGLFSRISYTGNHSLPVRLVIYFIMLLALPVIFVMPSDIFFIISKKHDKNITVQ
jgi:2-polyprenyl-3-methyl-5-hydroxy-6-metoxy-1,4-benzoquinol methylase